MSHSRNCLGNLGSRFVCSCGARHRAEAKRRAAWMALVRRFAQSSEAPPLSPSNASAGKEAHDEP